MFLSGVQGTFVNAEPLIGSLGATAVANGTLTLVAGAQKNNALSSPVTGNFYAQDHTEDCIYVGDLYGTMYRVDSIGKGQTPSVSRLFKFNPYPSGPDERPIRGKASIAYNEGGSGLWVYYGTGRYETAADKVNNQQQQQHFFGLKDVQAPRATPYSIADLTTLEARFTTSTIGGKALTVRTINGTNASANPWAMKLFAGQSGWGGSATIGGSERVFTKPLVVGGIVFFTTFVESWKHN
jgi:Tfp pilus tip-associated adhesin PilY1